MLPLSPIVGHVPSGAMLLAIALCLQLTAWSPGRATADFLGISLVDVTNPVTAANGMWTVEVVAEFDHPSDRLNGVSNATIPSPNPLGAVNTPGVPPGPPAVLPQPLAFIIGAANQCLKWDSFVTIGLDRLDGNAVALDPNWSSGCFPNWQCGPNPGGWFNSQPFNGQGIAGNYATAPPYPVLLARFTFPDSTPSITLSTLSVTYIRGLNGQSAVAHLAAPITLNAPAAPAPMACPPVGGMNRAYRITGNSSGTSWAWRIAGPSLTTDLIDYCVSGVDPAGDALAIAQAFAASINAMSASLGCGANQLNATTSNVLTTVGGSGCGATTTPFALLTVRVGDPTFAPTWDLHVGPCGTLPTCKVDNCLNACSFNGDIVEIPLSGRDCNGNDVDDAIDLLLGTSADLDGDGVPDECGAFDACGDASNPCSVSSGGPGCADAACCLGVCELDPFCCRVQWDGACVDLASILCVPSCAPGTITEPEPCGSAVNNGCAIGEGTPIECGTTVCGTFFRSVATRDLDTYTLVLSATTCVTWSVSASVIVEFGILTANCTQIAIGTPATHGSVTATLTAGSYTLVVAPSFLNPLIPCGTPESEYLATVQCAPCAPTCCPGAHQVIQLRSGMVNGVSGQPGQADDAISCVFGGVPGACFQGSLAHPTLGLPFFAACTGASANVIAPYPSWKPALTCDPLARWINAEADAQGLGQPGKSVLYCHPFMVTTPQEPGETCVDFCWSVDDFVGDPSTSGTGGVFIQDAHGTVTPLGFFGGANAVEYSNFNTTVGLSTGLNHLLVYQHNTGCQASGVIYSARIEICKLLEPGDLDGDGLVNGSDLGILLQSWGLPGPGDLNGDGVVNGGDLGLLLNAWTG